MNFDIIGEIDEVETVAKGPGIRDLTRLQKFYGHGYLAEDEGYCPHSAENRENPTGRTSLV